MAAAILILLSVSVLVIWPFSLDILANFHKCASNDCWVIAFCGKSKMAAIHHLKLIFGDSGPPTKSSCRLTASFQFRIDRIWSFEDIVIRKFSKFGLKCLFAAKKSVFGEFRPLNILGNCSEPQKALPCAKPRHISHHLLKSVQSFLL